MMICVTAILVLYLQADWLASLGSRVEPAGSTTHADASGARGKSSPTVALSPGTGPRQSSLGSGGAGPARVDAAPPEAVESVAAASTSSSVAAVDAPAVLAQRPGWVSLGSPRAVPPFAYEAVACEHAPARGGAEQRAWCLPSGEAPPPLSDARAPPFFLMGAQKAASTSFWTALVQHSPHVLPIENRWQRAMAHTWAKEALRIAGVGPATASVRRAGKQRDAAALAARFADLGKSYRDALPPYDEARVNAAVAELERHGRDELKGLRARELPAVALDGSVPAFRTEYLRVMRAAFSDDELQHVRYMMLLRHPSHRVQSSYNMYKRFGKGHPNHPAKDIDETMEDNIVALHGCVQRAIDRAGAAVGVDEALAGAVDWWPQCIANGEADANLGYLLGSFYAQTLRQVVCVLIRDTAGLGSDCPGWADAFWNGVLSPERQNRVLLLSFEEVLTQTTAAVNKALAFTGVPPLPEGEEVQLPRENSYPTTARFSERTAAAVDDVFRHEAALLARMLGGRDFGWDL